MWGFGSRRPNRPVQSRVSERPNQPVQRRANEYGNVLKTFQKEHKGNQLRFTLNEERKTNLKRLGINLNEALRRYNTKKTGNQYDPNFVKKLKNASRLIKKNYEARQEREKKLARTLSLKQAAILLYLVTRESNGIHIPALGMNAKNVRRQNANQLNYRGISSRPSNNILENRIAIARRIGRSSRLDNVYNGRVPRRN